MDLLCAYAHQPTPHYGSRGDRDTASGISEAISILVISLVMIVSYLATSTFLTGSRHRLTLEGSFGKAAFPNRYYGAPTMRTDYFQSLVFALLTCFSTFAIAAPTNDSAAVAQSAITVTEAVKVDLNKADAHTLQRELAGIGETKAQAIVAYRDINGPFASVDELLEVKGIGKAILDRNREKLEVN
jgi:competence protein ComEA